MKQLRIIQYNVIHVQDCPPPGTTQRAARPLKGSSYSYQIFSFVVWALEITRASPSVPVAIYAQTLAVGPGYSLQYMQYA
jgi:hypothetical protein